jgi:hypothetical protein
MTQANTETQNLRLKGMLGRSNASHDDEPILSERDHPDACSVCEKIDCECPEEEQDAQ